MDTIAVQSGSVQLAAAHQPGDGPPIVLVHGLASNLRIWDLVVQRLAGRRVVAYDQRGHGESTDADSYGFDDTAEDLHAVASSLGLDSPVVVGHSWGAAVALHYASTLRGCAGVIAVDGGILDMQAFGMSWDQTQSMLRPPLLEGDPDDVLALLRAASGPLDWQVQEPVALRSLRVGPDGRMRRRLPVDDHMRIVRGLWELHPADLLATVACPVLVVLAEEQSSRFSEAKRRAAQAVATRHPDVEIVWLSSVHDIPLMRPDELASLIRSFAARVA